MAVRHLKGHVSWVQTVDALIAHHNANLRMYANTANRLAHERFESEDKTLVTAAIESNFYDPC